MNKSLWQIAFRNVRRQYRRSVTTVLAFAFGFAGVILLGGYMLRMDRYLATQGIYLDHVGHIGVFKKDGLERSSLDPERYSLSVDDQARIESTARESLGDSLEFTGKKLNGEGLITNGCTSTPFVATGVDIASERRIRNHPEVLANIPKLAELKLGRGFWEIGMSEDIIAISARLAQLLKKPVIQGDVNDDQKAMLEIISDCKDPEALKRISSHSGVQLVGTSFIHSLAAADARIGAHYSTGLALTDDSSVLMTLPLMQRFLNTDKVTSISIYLRPGSWTPLAVDTLKRAFLKEQATFDVYPYYDPALNPFYVGSMSFVYVMTVFFLILVCGVVALSVLNSLQISLFERRSEIGMLRAMGFRPEVLTRLFVMETSLICGVGLLLGAALGVAVAELVNAANIRFKIVGSSSDLQLLIEPGWIYSFTVALIFAAAAGVTAVLICRRYLAQPVVGLLESK